MRSNVKDHPLRLPARRSIAGASALLLGAAGVITWVVLKDHPAETTVKDFYEALRAVPEVIAIEPDGPRNLLEPTDGEHAIETEPANHKVTVNGSGVNRDADWTTGTFTARCSLDFTAWLVTLTSDGERIGLDLNVNETLSGEASSCSSEL